MNNKKALVGGLIALLTVLACVFIFRMFFGSDQKENTPIEEPTPTPKYLDAPETVDVLLKINKARTAVDFTITGLESTYDGIEYEITYDSDSGQNGALSGSRPIPLTGESSFTRPVELGTCSTGGKCTYHKNPKNFKVVVKLHTSSGDIYLLTKEFPSL
jgi:hypothetical protein